jgi:lipopolysaccharide transport system ATP-binding protein
VVEALSDVHQPIVGFTFKDKLGQALFGDNSYLTFLEKKMTLNKGNKLVALFQFQIPILPRGLFDIYCYCEWGSEQS